MYPQSTKRQNRTVLLQNVNINLLLRGRYEGENDFPEEGEEVEEVRIPPDGDVTTRFIRATFENHGAAHQDIIFKTIKEGDHDV